MLKDTARFNESVEENTALLNELQEKLPEFFFNARRSAQWDNSENAGGRAAETEVTFDLEKFKRALSESDINHELTSGYSLEWTGKQYAKLQAGKRSTTVIVPDVKHNSEPENADSHNLFLTGDNLEVLRHLQANYSSSVDFIYIDPPYNTGSDGFVYPDDFEYTDQQLADQFGLDSDGVKRLKSIQGRATHSAWLSFMYPRLWLAKRLLKNTGVIFTSIDDNEQANLKLLMDEVFGEGNFVANLVWQSTAGSNTGTEIVTVTENILVYARERPKCLFDGNPQDESNFTLSDDYEVERGKYSLDKLDRRRVAGHYSASLDYPLVMPDGSVRYPGGGSEPSSERWNYLWSATKVEWGIKNGFIEFTKNREGWSVYNKRYSKVDNEGNRVRKSSPFRNIVTSDKFNTAQGTAELSAYFGSGVFDFPKPSGLIRHFLATSVQTNKDAIVLDFFAGSATTADAVMQLNAEDGGNRKYIMVQLPEPTPKDSSARKAGYDTIDEISRERIKRAAKKIREEAQSDSTQQKWLETADLGFKHYRFIEPSQKTLEQIEDFDELESQGALLSDDMVSPFSSTELAKAENVANPVAMAELKATGQDTILQTYLVEDGYQFDVLVEQKDIDGYPLSYVDGTRVYIINPGWHTAQTKTLVNLIGRRELAVQAVVVYGYSLGLEDHRELALALSQLDTKPQLIVRY